MDDAATVLAALRANPQEAREKFGRRVGVSRTTYYFLRGAGDVLNVDDKGVTVALSADEPSPDVLLATGRIFDNTVRDATGLLTSSDFPNSQHFNDLARRFARAGRVEARS